MYSVCLLSVKLDCASAKSKGISRLIDHAQCDGYCDAFVCTISHRNRHHRRRPHATIEGQPICVGYISRDVVTCAMELAAIWPNTNKQTPKHTSTHTNIDGWDFRINIISWCCGIEIVNQCIVHRMGRRKWGGSAHVNCVGLVIRLIDYN